MVVPAAITWKASAIGYRHFQFVLFVGHGEAVAQEGRRNTPRTSA
jgi:hypothetical protein